MPEWGRTWQDFIKDGDWNDAYISYYHVPPQFYGVLFGAGILGIMVTNLLNARLVVLFGIARLLRAGTAS